jgi:hypothetical protein
MKSAPDAVLTEAMGGFHACPHSMPVPAGTDAKNAKGRLRGLSTRTDGQIAQR